MNTEKRYKIMLADDHVLLRDALSGLINSFEECYVSGTVGNGKELMQFIKDGHIPDLVLLDVNMPVMDGYETAKVLQEEYPYIKVLILTMFDTEIPLIRLLQYGVRGFLKKDIHPNELKNAILTVAADGFYYSHDTTGKLANLFRKSNGKAAAIEKSMLTDQEIDFLKMATTDLTYKEIAQKMDMSPRAIDGYRDHLFDKLDVKSRVGLAIYAVKNGIVTF